MRLSISFPATAGCRSLPMNRAPARSAGLSPGILMTRCLTMAMSTSICAARLPMVNAVSGALRERGINPAGFWYEKFLASQSAAA